MFDTTLSRRSPRGRRRTQNPLLGFPTGFEDFFSDFFPALQSPGEPAEHAAFTPRLSLRETEEAYELTAELPGVSREEIELQLEDGVLRLTGEKTAVATSESPVLHEERVYGRFERALRLPKEVDGDAVMARFEDGVLTVELPKLERSPKRKIDIRTA